MMRIGIVGAGGMGTVHHSNYTRIPDCRVTAPVGKSPQDRERAVTWGLKMYEPITEMVHSEEIDLMDIYTPTFLYKQQVLESLESEKHTIVEKLATLHRNDVEEMFAFAAQQDVQLYVVQVLQFTNETVVLCSLVQSGEYGPAPDGYFERLSARPCWVQNGWLFDSKKSGLAPFDLYIHDLDSIVGLFGEPEESSFTCYAETGRGLAEQYRFQYRFGKLNVCAEAAWFHVNLPFTARWRIYFGNAVVVNDGTSVITYLFDTEPRMFGMEEKIKTPTGINVPPTDWYSMEFLHFIRYVEQNAPSPLVRLEQVAAVTGILEKMLAHSL